MSAPGSVVPYVVLAAAVVVIARRARRRSGGAPDRSGAHRASLLARLLGDAGLVAAREVRDRVRGRIFRVGTALILVAVVLGIALPARLSTKQPTERVGVVGALPGPLAGAVTGTGRHLGARVELVAEQDLAAAKAALRSGTVSIVLVRGKELLVPRGLSTTDTSTTAQLARSLAATLGAEEAVTAAGLTPAQASRLSAAKPLPVRGLEAGRTTTAQATSLIGLPLLFVLFMVYNSWILLGVMEEKSSRVVEVLLSAIRPIQLLAGKVLGIGLVALAQAGLVLAAALVTAEAVGSDVLKGTTPRFLAAVFAWLLLGYAFYCWVYAAVGSTAERRDQVQGLVVPLTAPLTLGYIVAIAAQASGNPSTLVEVLAYLPPTAPFAMPALVALGAVRWWQFAASALLSVAATVLVARLAAVVYRRAILRTGRRVGLRQLLSNAS